MKKVPKRLLWLALSLGILAMIPAGIWFSLTYQPAYYRDIVLLPRQQREDQAKKFVTQSLQLRNDICNEPTWEAVFTDQEVNAWLAEDLVTHFVDQLPPEIHQPRLVFELDRITLAFQLRQRGLDSVITVVARPRVPEGNTVELTLERIRAGILPVPADPVIDRIIEYARFHGVDVEWTRKDGYPVVVLRYTPNIEREDVQLEEVQIPRARFGSRDGPTEPEARSTGPFSPRARCFNPSFRCGSSRSRPIRTRIPPGGARLPPPVENPPPRRGRGQPTRPTIDNRPDPGAELSPGCPTPLPHSPDKSADGPPEHARATRLPARSADRWPRSARPGPIQA